MWQMCRVRGRLVRVRIMKYRKPRTKSVELKLDQSGDVSAKAVLSAMRDIPH